MDGIMNKAKSAMSGKKEGGSTGGAGGQQSGAEKFTSGQVNKQVDAATDRFGMGDKYDDKINKLTDGQINNNIPGGAGSK